eukprot:3644898-Prymnesium_polylepis.2
MGRLRRRRARGKGCSQRVPRDQQRAPGAPRAGAVRARARAPSRRLQARPPRPAEAAASLPQDRRAARAAPVSGQFCRGRARHRAPRSQCARRRARRTRIAASRDPRRRSSCPA